MSANQGRLVALTFDDGPSDGDSTDRILAILNNYGISATFCVVGRQVESHPGKVTAEYRAGHLIENHSRTHREFSTLTYGQMVDEIDSVTAQIQGLGIPAPRYFRPPCGDGDGETLDRVLNERGLTALYWSIDSRDWEIHDVDTVHDNVLRDLRAGWDAGRRKDIVLFHDTQAPTPQVVDRLIPELLAEGCHFVLADAIA